MLRLACAARRATALSEAVVDAETEVSTLRAVAGRILRAHTLDEALLSATDETRALLDADIAGVLLRDGDEIFMRSCAGNRFAETSHLRMRRGQGLAGLVFATGEAAKVDDYLADEVISDDFRNLARLEQTRSALAAPLIVDGDVIGVLEVWRRRESQFSAGDTRRLVALADLTAIALDNARLHALSLASAREAEHAHRLVEAQLDRVERSMQVQQELVEALVAGAQLPSILRIVAERGDCQVVLLSVHGDDLACWPPDVDTTELAAAVSDMSRARGPESDQEIAWLDVAGQSVAVGSVVGGRERVAWMCLTGGRRTREEVELATRQAAISAALHLLEQEAASRARANLREEMLLHLLRGSREERGAAIARARYLHVDLSGALRVVVCRLGALSAAASRAGWPEPDDDRARRKLISLYEAATAGSGVLRLIAVNGDDIVALIRGESKEEIREELAGVTLSIRATLPGVPALWGVSAAHTNPSELADAFQEATTAVQALRRDSHNNIALYEDLGVLGLLIAGPRGVPLTDFAADTLGGVLAHDAKNGTRLLETLRAYLDHNCSQRDTAAALFVHQKTVKYRLDVIERLTGLHMSEHRDRMRADIAVRAIDLN